MKLLTKVLTKDASEGIANFVATNIEASLNTAHDCDTASKAYEAKAKSLVFNLGANEVR
jgi:hypothetical protein